MSAIMGRRRAGPHRAGGGGGAGCGVVLATPYDDNFDCGSALDTSGTRFSGANAWTLVNGPIISEAIVSDEWRVETQSRGGGWDPTYAYQAVPSGDWEFETYAHQGINDQVFESVGLFLGESATGKGVNFGAGCNGGGRGIGAGNSGGYYATAAIGSWTTDYTAYLRVARVGSSITYSYSLNGSSWTTLLTHAQTVPFTTAPDQVGVVKQNAIATGLTFRYGYFGYFHRTA